MSHCFALSIKKIILENILKETKLKLQMPEEEITLCFPSATEKDIWSQKIVETIVKSTAVRHPPSTWSKNDQSDDEKMEEGTPDLPSERTGSYKFKLGRLKGCSYSGEWYNGKMHGKARDSRTRFSQMPLRNVLVYNNKGVSCCHSVPI